jgi:hypothetical protein
MTGLNFQDVDGGKIPAYQAKQLIRMIKQYWNFDANRLKTQDEINADAAEQESES